MRGGWKHEQRLWRSGLLRVAGMDEAGRGPLAGPVVAAAIILPRGFSGRGINDSKQMTPEDRGCAFLRLTQSSEYAVGIATVDEIDRFNILRASYLAMHRAIEGLKQPPEHVLVDGLPIGPAPFAYTALVEGDARCISIAAASIIAKVTRDRLMEDLDRCYPEYGFARHKGYSTPQHLDALLRVGPCEQHRKSFAPVLMLKQLALFE